MSNECENMRTADIVAEALIDWKVDVIFGLPGDGINGFIESLRRRQLYSLEYSKVNAWLYFPVGHPFCSVLTILCKIYSVLLMTPFG